MWIDDAYAEADRDESIGKWQRVFGDEFAKNAVITKAAAVSEEARALVSATALTPPGFVGDLVTLFARFGRRALPANFDRLPHKQRPPWRSLPSSLFRVNVVASLHSNRNGVWINASASGTGPLPKHNWLKFEARTGVGSPISSDYEIQWRVTNTDVEARRANALRGGYVQSNGGSSHWEQLAYRGVHTVEAFILRKRDQMLVSHSEPFYVVIG